MLNKITKRAIGTVGVAAAAFLLLSAPAAMAEPSCTALLAGQSIDVGTVCVDNDGDYLTVTYSTTGGWTLDEVHLAVEQDFANIPQTRKGNPVPGQFDYSANLNGETTYTFQIPLGDLGVVDPCDPTLFYVASHAVVIDPNGDGTATETAWGKGNRFVAKGNWATYFTYTTQCPPGPEDPGGCTKTDTAIAWGETSFEEFGWNRWGWENLVVASANTLVRDLLAGQTTDVGDVQISYNGSLLTVQIFANQNVTLDQVHIQVEDSSISGYFKNNPSWGNATVDGVLFKELATVDQSEGTTYFQFQTGVDFDHEGDGIYVTVHTSTTRSIACPVD